MLGTARRYYRKKEGKLKSNKQVNIMDLPGIYSLSPYSLEEVITRDYILKEKPDAIINIVDGSKQYKGELIQCLKFVLKELHNSRRLR